VTATHYVAYVQMVVRLHNDTLEVVEAPITFPIFYRPRMGDYLNHTVVSGVMPVGPTFFDEERDTVVLSIAGLAYDKTTTLDEWLKDRPSWRKAVTPFIDLVQEKPHDTEDSTDSEID